MRLAVLEACAAQLREQGMGDDAVVCATVDKAIRPDRVGARPIRTLSAFSSPDKHAASQNASDHISDR